MYRATVCEVMTTDTKEPMPVGRGEGQGTRKWDKEGKGWVDMGSARSAGRDAPQ